MNGYYGIGEVNGPSSYYALGQFLPDFSLISSNVSAAATSAAKLSTNPTAAQRADVKAAFGRGLSPADVKANKTAWPIADYVIDQIHSEWKSGGSSGGFGFDDITSGFTSFLKAAAPIGQAAIQYKLQQDQLKQLERSGRGQSSQAAALRTQLATQPGYAPQSSGTPSWLLPVAIIGGLGMFGLIAIALIKK